MTRSQPLTVSAALFLALTLSSCSAIKGLSTKAVRSKSVRDAGSVHLAVLAVAPWSHYAQALQPGFELTGEQARALVVRNSMSEVEMNNSRTGIAMGVEQNAQAAPTLPDVSNTGSSITAISAGQDRPDAMLEYWNATSLFQEVQLLNHSLRDAAIPSGQRAYLVRLQLSLVPRKRHQPYDAYATLSFFSPERPPSSSSVASSGAGAERIAGLTPTTSLRDLAAGPPATGPSVLPLLVSDNLESSSISRSQEETRRLALSMAGFPGNFAAKATADLMQSSLAAQVAGRDLNSLLTVARVSENTLRVRIGAMREPTAGHAMVPRNHFVTLLLMVPETAPPVVHVLARTSLIDTETGAELPGTTEEELAQAFESVQREHGFTGLDRGALEALLAHAQRNDQTAFHALLRQRMGPEYPGSSAAQALWMDLVGLMVGSRWASSSFELPGHGRWEILPESFYDQTVLIVDDGSKETRVNLLGARFAPGVDVSARLRAAIAGSEVSLPAERVEIDDASRRLQLVFPSLATLGLGQPEREGCKLNLAFGSETVELQGLYVLHAAN